MASDFAIAQFRFLTPLLLVHGRLNYKRLTRMILFFFYKNLLFGTTIFVYNAFALFRSGGRVQHMHLRLPGCASAMGRVRSRPVASWNLLNARTLPSTPAQRPAHLQRLLHDAVQRGVHSLRAAGRGLV